MKVPEHHRRLYQILQDTERLLGGAPATAPIEERVAQIHERGWDARDHASDEPKAEPLPEILAEPIAPASTLEERKNQLAELGRHVQVCEQCPLSEGRTNAVPGDGVLDPLVMVVGEGPGFHEDQQGRAFVGNAGAYLDKWLSSIGLSREKDTFITNIVKCRPPSNRDPQAEEIEACRPFLARQIALVRPRVVLTVGRISTRVLTGASQGITRIHGTFYDYEGIPLIPTFHPSAVLRNPDYRRPVWEDLKKLRNWLIDNAGHNAERHD